MPLLKLRCLACFALLAAPLGGCGNTDAAPAGNGILIRVENQLTFKDARYDIKLDKVGCQSVGIGFSDEVVPYGGVSQYADIGQGVAEIYADDFVTSFYYRREGAAFWSNLVEQRAAEVSSRTLTKGGQYTVTVDTAEIRDFTAAANRSYHCSVVKDDLLWVIAGQDLRRVNTYLNDTWYSRDGAVWDFATLDGQFNGRINHECVSLGGKLWVLAGDRADDVVLSGVALNDVWSSLDGAEWTEVQPQAPWPARSSFAAVAFQDQIWILGGYGSAVYLNDVWSSSDGVTWTQASPAAPWKARLRPSAVVFDNRLWVLGGHTPGQDLNDVWYSADGVTWTEATPQAAWPPKMGQKSVAFAGRLWVFVGKDDAAGVWSSADGSTWSLVSGDVPWSMTTGSSAAVYNGQMVVMDSGASTLRGWGSQDGATWTQLF